MQKVTPPKAHTSSSSPNSSSTTSRNKLTTRFKMEFRRTGFIVLLCLAACLSATSLGSRALETRGNPTSRGATNGTARLQKLPNEGVCGTLDDLAKRVEVCAKPLMDLLQGTVEKWPRNEDDAMKLCDSFLGSERCIRDVSRKCGKGIQKTIISTLALSISRARKRECSKAKAAAVVKTTMCLERNQNTIQDWMGNVTGRLSAIELQTQDGDKKINGICCMLRDIESEIKDIMQPLCPTESALVTRLYRTVLEDVIELVCRNPKCRDYMKDYRVVKAPNFSGLISIMLRIVFSLDAN